MNLRNEILQALRDRQDWADRQSTWYQMRHGGLRRKVIPYPNAPDLHFPLIDATIDKHKPFYVQALFADEDLASFVALRPEQEQCATDLAGWFSYQVKQNTNFEREAISAIDCLLQNGGCPVKVYWDAKAKRVAFCACDPLHVIVPKWTEELKEADWLVHVLHMSEAQYRANETYRQEDDFIKAIKGKGDADSGDSTDKIQDKDIREGLTCGQDDNQIVLWEIQRRDPSDWNKIMVETRSPLRYNEEVRSAFERPYSQGVLGKGKINFVKWRGEIKDKGYYAPRGVAEILGSHEASISKTWNFKHEWMDFFSRPRFKRTPGATLNTSNIKGGPGSVLEEGIEPINPPPIPSSLDQEMNMTREMAEYRLQAPDFGVLGQNGGKRTATEVNAIGGQTQQGTDLRARVFRMDRADTFEMAWALYLQYGGDSLAYVLDGAAKSLDSQALADVYEITPNGSADSWNKAAQMQKAVARFQMFQNSPFVKQGPLVKSVLAADEPGLVKQLFQEPEDAQKSEREEQNIELVLMSSKFAASVDETDDDKVHLQVIGEWFMQRMKEQPPLDPITAQLVFQHIQEHGAALHKKKDPMVSQIDRLIKPVSGALLQISQQNVIPMGQGQAPSTGSLASNGISADPNNPGPVPSGLLPNAATQ